MSLLYPGKTRCTRLAELALGSRVCVDAAVINAIACHDRRVQAA
jgi:hypothetical protein